MLQTRLTIEDLVSLIIRQMRACAEQSFGNLGNRAIVGRPVHYVGAKDSKDEDRALRRMSRALELAGFDQVHFELEPIAAAYSYEQALDHDECIMVADFGGGTSDFCIMHVGPHA